MKFGLQKRTTPTFTVITVILAQAATFSLTTATSSSAIERYNNICSKCSQLILRRHSLGSGVTRFE